MHYLFCLNLFKEKDNLRNAILNQISMSYFKFWYLVQGVTHIFIHALNICWPLPKYQVYIVGLDLFLSFDLNNNESAS